MLPRLLRVLKQDGYRIVELTPGPGRIATVPAPAGWKSQTEATLARMMPRLLAEQAREGSRGRRLTRKRLVLR